MEPGGPQRGPPGSIKNAMSCLQRTVQQMLSIQQIFSQTPLIFQQDMASYA